jgi:hypothetical protein
LVKISLYYCSRFVYFYSSCGDSNSAVAMRAYIDLMASAYGSTTQG